MSRAVVLGSGIVGLWTATVLHERGHEVKVISPLDPCQTYSAAAAAVITPLLPWSHDHPSFIRSWGWYRRTIARLKHLDSTVCPHGGLLEPMPSYECGFESDGERVLEKGFSLSRFNHLPFAKVDVIDLDPPVGVDNHPGEHHQCTFCARFTADFCNTSVCLRFLKETALKAGVHFEHRAVEALSDSVLTEECDIIFNCMGFNSKRLFLDHNLYHVRGQSMFVDPARGSEDACFGIASGHHAVFRHRRGLYIGSYFIEKEGQVRTFPAEVEYQYSIRFATAVYPEICARLGLKPAVIDLQRITRVNTGIRPFRPDGPRVEVDEDLLRSPGLRVIHNYGHGAHGWTIGLATSEDAVNLGETRGWLRC
jgi:glycine/D-amino acid oxidase-like deaminating enzyme